MDRIDVASLDLLFIENVGNLICPVGFDLGQDAKVGIFCTTGGDDKAAKHPYIVCESSLLLLNKMDLISHVPFNRQIFRDDIAWLNPDVPVIELSAITGQGLDAWLNWLQARRQAARDELSKNPLQPSTEQLI